MEDDKQFTATFTVAEARALLQQLPQDTDQSEAYKNARLVLLLGIKAAK